jgi:HSCB C-terminal oligomerisation domain.
LQYVITRYLGEPSEAEKKQTPPELLMRLMEIREQLEQFKHERSDSLRAALQHEQSQLETERDALDQQIDTFMQAFDEATTPEAKRSALMEIRKLMLKKNYLHSLIATIQNELNPETV